MKKILLLLISSLLIASMAGSAMALPYDAFLWNEAGTGASPSDIDLAPGQSKVLSYHGENINSLAFGVPLRYSYDVDVKPGSSGSEDDIIVSFSHDSFVPTGPLSTDVGVITVTNVKGPVGAQYLVKVSAGEDGIEFGMASRTVNSIPEFPTVALPVAAILGLVFVFGRKKDGL